MLQKLGLKKVCINEQMVFDFEQYKNTDDTDAMDIR
jgi:hypothetical protein